MVYGNPGACFIGCRQKSVSVWVRTIQGSSRSRVGDPTPVESLPLRLVASRVALAPLCRRFRSRARLASALGATEADGDGAPGARTAPG